MKDNLLVILVVLQYVVRFVQGTTNTQVEYVSLGETKILTCQNLGASTLIWQRKGYLISMGLEINLKADGYHRLKITGDLTKGEYNLKISNITEEDLGIYWCEVQINKFSKQTKVSLKLEFLDKEPSSTNMEFTTYTELQSSSRARDIKLSTIIHTNFTAGTIPETGFSSNEKLLYYGILAGSLVLVVCLSVTCNLCIINKYRSGNLNTPDKTVNVNANNPSRDPEDISSNYESICESELISNAPKHEAELSIEAQDALHKHPDHDSSTSKRSTLEVTNDSTYHNACLKSTENSQSDKFPEIRKHDATSQKDTITSDNHSNIEESSNKDQNHKVFQYQKPSNENCLAMINFAGLSDSVNSEDESDQHVCQNGDKHGNEYERLETTDQDTEHDYNICQANL